MKGVVLLSIIVLIAGCVGQVSQVKVEPSVSLKMPVIFTTETGKPFVVEWNITNEPTIIEHTAVHYGNAHTPLIEGTLHISPSETVYTKLTKVQSGNVPNEFRDAITSTQSGLLYGRAHAVIDGVNYWSDEFVVTVKGNAIVPKPVESPTNEFSVKVDDGGFYPSSVSVKSGEKVKIVLVFNDQNIYFGGLDVKGGDFPTIHYIKGSNKNESIEFVGSKPFTLTSYWPATGVVKGTLDVVVS